MQPKTGVTNSGAKGSAREASVALAHQIAAFPQACMRADRLSAYEQHGQNLAEAMQNELAHGLSALPETQAGAQRFADGDGRHGDV